MPFDNAHARFAAGSLRAHRAGWKSWIAFHRSTVPHGACVTSSCLHDYITSLRADGKSVLTIEAYLRGVATGYALLGENDRLLPLRQYPWWLATTSAWREANRNTPTRVGRSAAAGNARDRLLLALTLAGFAHGALCDLSWHRLDAIADPAIKRAAAAWRHVAISQHRDDARRAQLVFPATTGRFVRMSPRAIKRIIANLSVPKTTKGR